MLLPDTLPLELRDTLMVELTVPVGQAVKLGARVGLPLLLLQGEAVSDGDRLDVTQADAVGLEDGQELKLALEVTLATSPAREWREVAGAWRGHHQVRSCACAGAPVSPMAASWSGCTSLTPHPGVTLWHSGQAAIRAVSL